jgi:hypothetical protein
MANTTALSAISQYTIYITKSGSFIKYGYLKDEKYVKKIDNYFTLSTQLITGKTHKLKSAKVDKKNERIIIPRFGIKDIIESKYLKDNVKVISQLNPGQAPSKPFVWRGTQTANQKIISEHIMKNIYTKPNVDNGSAGLILNLEAGQGKSYLAAYMISQLQTKTAIILHTTSLLKQWENVLKDALGNDVSIGYYYSGKHKLGDIMLLIINSASQDEMDFKIKREIKKEIKREVKKEIKPVTEGKQIPNKKEHKKTITEEIKMKSIDFYNQFGFIIYDECHIYSNKMSIKTLKLAQAPYMLGLSATPDEHVAGFDNIVWWHLGPVLNANSLSGYSATSEDFKATVHRVSYYGPDEYTKHLVNQFTQVTDTAQTINMICEDPYRACLVVQCIKEGLDKGLNMFIFADRRCYLIYLMKLFEKMYNIRGELLDDKKSKVNDDKSNEKKKSKVNDDKTDKSSETKKSKKGTPDSSVVSSKTAQAITTSNPGLPATSANITPVNIKPKPANIMRIVGGASDEKVAKAEQESRAIFTTYLFMGTGKSIVKMNGLVLATPRKTKMKQYINRIFRLGSDATIERHIWDVCDMYINIKNQWTTRKKYYSSKGYKIVEKKVKYEDIEKVELEEGNYRKFMDVDGTY